MGLVAGLVLDGVWFLLGIVVGVVFDLCFCVWMVVVALFSF